jgi:hypothetical protein
MSRGSWGCYGSRPRKRMPRRVRSSRWQARGREHPGGPSGVDAVVRRRPRRGRSAEAPGVDSKEGRQHLRAPHRE